MSHDRSTDLRDVPLSELQAELQRRADEPQVEVTWQASSKAGSCNCCTRHIRLQPPGTRAHQVLVVRGRSTEFRICSTCWRDIKRLAGQP